ncbi:MAG: tetratricopeptide repeat protein [bacterium]|nr:tetratricopeptide repeat protein [bacterium]
MIARAHPLRLFLVVALCAALGSGGVQAGKKTKETLRFAADMAKSGNWREARYRWRMIEREQPDNAHILNNLAVAAEALGDEAEARDYYRKALAAADGDSRIHDNHNRFARFWREIAEETGAEPAGDMLVHTPPPAGKGKGAGKVFRATVGLPVPPRLELEGTESILVASFLTEENALIDTNRELVRFLRSEFGKRTGLDVLPVVPPPAVPEQRVEDLLANHEFWKHLSREYGADIIVSGVVRYDREDASGFQDVDVVSARTGQKVRETRFVDQEEFRYTLDLFFMRGSTGELLVRERMRRSLIFRGQQNDPLTAFYEMSDSIAADVLSVVVPRVRRDGRVVFKM